MLRSQSQFANHFSLRKKVIADVQRRVDRRLTVALASLAKRTQANYRGHMRRLDDWLEATGAGELTDATLAEYMLHLLDEGKAARSIEQVIPVVRFRARALDQPPPTGRMVEMMRRRVRRETAGRGKGKAKGLTLEEIEAMIRKAESAPVGRRPKDAALMAVMFYAGLRAGEAGALRVEDFTFFNYKTAQVKVRRSKTDQGGVGAVLPLPEAAVRRIEAWLVEAQISQGSVFRGVRNQWDGSPAVFGRAGGIKPWSVNRIVTQWAEACGFEGVTSHSCAGVSLST